MSFNWHQGEKNWSENHLSSSKIGKTQIFNRNSVIGFGRLLIIILLFPKRCKAVANLHLFSCSTIKNWFLVTVRTQLGCEINKRERERAVGAKFWLKWADKWVRIFNFTLVNVMRHWYHYTETLNLSQLAGWFIVCLHFISIHLTDKYIELVMCRRQFYKLKCLFGVP